MKPGIKILRATFATAVVLLMVFPMVVVVASSFNPATYISFPPHELSLHWYGSLANDPLWAMSAVNSVIAGLVATAITFVIGLPVSIALVRGSFRGQRLIYGLVMSPIIVPQILTALGLYYVLTPVHLTGSPLIIGLGHVVLCLPVFVLIVCSSLAGFDVRLEDAAVSLGASRLRAVQKITLPALAPGLIAACLFSFLTSFDELVIALLLSDPTSRTLPVSIWSSMIFETNPIITAVSVYVFLLTIAAFVLTHLLSRARRQQREQSPAALPAARTQE
ncbi:ABC transporter permease [Kribbella sp. NPDC059898]|uniref:ABC transporter permease n=1 Tax=Kribbella sp. NPDC059898 TaxID=3346995 RepID=UPI0036665CDB